jgi:hypothetical protein
MTIEEYGSVTIEESVKQIFQLALLAAVLYPIVWLFGFIKNAVVGAFDLLINGAKGVKNSVLSLVGLR